MINQPNLENIKKLRKKTGASILKIKQALEESKGNPDKALTALQKWAEKEAAKKKGQATSAGLVEAYIHVGGKVGSLIVLSCQTDFVARTNEFKQLAHEIAMQVASMDPKNVNELLNQSYIRDPKKTIKSLVDESIAKMGENIEVKKIIRFSI